MESTIGHIYFYVPDLEKSYQFYKKFLEFIGYKENCKYDWGFSFTNNGTSIWFEETPKKWAKDKFHRRKSGLNHLAFRLNSKENVDKFFKEFLKKGKIATLYQTPKHFPEYEKNYYAVFFEDPDRLKIEIVYHP